MALMLLKYAEYDTIFGAFNEIFKIGPFPTDSNKRDYLSFYVWGQKSRDY